MLYNVKIKEISFKMELGSPEEGALTHVLLMGACITSKKKENKNDLDRGSQSSHTNFISCFSIKSKKIPLCCTTAHHCLLPMRTHHNLEILFSNEPFLKTTLPNFFPKHNKSWSSLCLWICLWFAIVHLSQTQFLCYSQINSFCW